jgi:hypothetical protein
LLNHFLVWVRFPDAAELGSSTSVSDCVLEDDPLPPDNKGIKLPTVMAFVEPLCLHGSNLVTGLPVWNFVVHGVDGSVLYYFTAEVKPSDIPDSGLGVFLTLKKVTELPKKEKDRYKKLVAEHVHLEPESLDPLQYTSSGGYGGTLDLCGKRLNENGSRMYVPLTKTKLEAIDPNSGKRLQISLVGHGIHYDEGDEPLVNGIGVFGVHNECDFLPAHDHVFKSTFGSIDLGLYGPLRIEGKVRALFPC